ncbi:hypothetical protein IMCC26134_04285 [Verrucomicrobia bacterium IMCC26134]|nr:hypothetical protein IMCC26134_04285 [Verrucomicrobia bacterium IMCC26134]
MRILLIALLGTITASAQITPKTKIEEIYATYCAACHGAKFEGGQGGSLVDGIWKHGGSDEEIARTITKGKPELGMVPWENVLSANQIRTMVVFLRENEKREKARGATPPPKPEPGKVTATTHESYRIEIVTEGLKAPWSLAFLPDGKMLVTEKAGPVRIVARDGTLDPVPLAGTPAVQTVGQGGMLEVAPHPDYAKNGWVYLSFSDGWKGEDNKARALTSLVRGRIKDHQWTDQETIYKADAKYYTSAGVHFGSRIVFDQGYIYFVVGERGGRMEVQDVTRPNGKIFRLHEDGRIPADNPFVETPNAEKGIWSYGHRNPQGLAMDPRDHSLYETEHGPRGGDEFNLILKGRNYGWPVITYGMDYNGTAISAITAKEGMEQPLTYWLPSIATCGLACYDGTKFPKWRYDFFAGGLAGQQVVRLRMAEGKVAEQEIILKDIGRIRDVRCGPDGYLYLITNAPDRIVRLIPAN